MLPILIVVVVAALVFVGFRVSQSNKSSDQETKTSANTSKKSDTNRETGSYIEWSYNGNTWMAMNQGKPAPECDEPLTIGVPMDLSKATNVLYPGQVRGGDYKSHGGIGTDQSNGNSLDVKMPYTAYLYRGAKYKEQGEVQYLLDFVAPCGIMIRLDHLRTLSSEMQTLTKDLPEGAESDSRTTKFSNNALVKQGTLVATEVGFKSTNNAFFDLGVYDLRAPNEASKDPTFANEPKRLQDKEQSYYSVCWFDLLTGKVKTTVAALPARGSEGKVSDFCK